MLQGMTLWTVEYQALLSMGFPRQEYWSGLSFPSPGHLHNTRTKPGSPELQADSLPFEPLLLLSHFSRVRLCTTHRRQPTRLPRPWDSPGKNTGVGCHFLLRCMKVKSESEVAQSCPTLSDPMDCSPPGSSVHGIFQARVLEWVAIAFSDNPEHWFLKCGPQTIRISTTWKHKFQSWALPPNILNQKLQK